MTLTKKALAEALHHRLNLNKEESQEAIEIILRFISELADGDKIEIRGFGTFSRKKVSTKGKRNPMTGVVVVGKEYTTLRFKASPALREHV